MRFKWWVVPLILVAIYQIWDQINLPIEQAVSTPRIRAEFIDRQSNEKAIPVFVSEVVGLPRYPWQNSSSFPKITKEFFRCRGDVLHPSKIEMRGSEKIYYHDCTGRRGHSLPLREGKEFIYPTLIELLNFLQDHLQHRVVVTSGHCCPAHYAYLLSSSRTHSSRALIGAQADFYIEGLEKNSEIVIRAILSYYEKLKETTGLNWTNFVAGEALETGGRPSLSNEEIVLQVWEKDERRNDDNRHPYPYFTVQVKYDRQKKQRVNKGGDPALQIFYQY